MRRWLERRWYGSAAPPRLLLPLSALYGAVADRVAATRKAQAVRLSVPVIVIGNIAVGGTGKTPLTLWFVDALRELGWKPGVISRGYGGRAANYPLRVTAATDAQVCGDEPALIARRTRVPMAVAPDRVAAGQLLIDSGEVDILIADDGLQHYRLARDLEVCVIDGARGVGNGARLPAGPLRERPARLETVDLVVVNGVRTARLPPLDTATVSMQLELGAARALADGGERPLASFQGQRVHAVAGLGNPQRFFEALAAAGLDVIPHALPDHHCYAEIDLAFGDGLPVLLTEKDAVKCAGFSLPQLWMIPATARLAADDAARVRQLLLKFQR
ncbi:MAG: tetraacyldisaccharide 4'-kinase [Nevskia sp.]